MQTVTLINSRMLSPSVREMTFDAGRAFDFEPGQWVSFHMPSPSPEEEFLARSYSIASGPRNDGSFDIAVTQVDAGPGSNYLHALSHGSTISMTRAQGFFTLDEYETPLLMIATGTGITPFRAMLQDLASRFDELPHPITLLLGAREAQDLLYADEMTRLEDTLKGFHFLPTLSRPEPTWSGLTGHVQRHISPIIENLPALCEVYICGPSDMVKQTRHLLKSEHGLSRNRIHTERFG